MNMKEIAELAGVSVAAVSYTLNGTGNISEKKRKEILEIVAKEGYSPNRIAKSLRTKKSSTIGIMVEDITSFQTPRILNGINEYAEKNEYTVILNNLGLFKKTGKNMDVISEHRKILKKGMELFEKAQVDGIVYASHHDRDVSGLLPQFHIPVVLAYCYDMTHQNYCVTYDNTDISKEIAKYLAGHHHRDVGIICGADSSRPAQKRYSGYIEGLEECGIDPERVWTFTGDWEFESGEAAYKQYKRLRIKPTAVFAMNDLMAVGFMDAALNDGKKIPEDISIVGFDNRQECRFTRPRLTTVDIPLEQMGKEAAKLLLNLIKDGKADDRKIILPCSFIEKESVAAIESK